MTSGGDAPVLDLLGLNCPLPVLRTRRAIADMPAGARLVVRASDPLAALDLPHFCAEEGHRVLRLTQEDGVITVEIERGAASPQPRPAG